MKRKSNQRITKIKIDTVERLLDKAESISVQDATEVQPIGADLVPYPDLIKLRHWTRDYLLKGLTKIYPVKLDENGQTFMTTLIDGLPLFTKMTKTIDSGEETISVPWIQPILTANGTIGGDTAAAEATSTESAYNAFEAFDNNPSTYWGPAGGSGGTLTFYTPEKVRPTSIDFSFREASEIFRNCTVTASIDNNSYTELGSYSGLGSIVHTLELSNVTEQYKYFKFQFSNPDSGWGKVNILINGVQENTVMTTFETSKPGLWLSNLVAPISNSPSGAWLRHNLISSESQYFNTVNSDIIGNYSWSYLQRGIYHRTAGSSHDDMDSFCQHWSPSALSCISHEAIIIPTNLLRSTYTTYQTLVTPVDANMQYYEDGLSKNIEYTFVDNNDNVPLTTTQFNGRVVGNNWTYELEFEPNHLGSKCNYGQDPECTNSGGSNGGCVTGEIVYYDEETGIACTQTVNSCFLTNQALFNPLVPDSSEAQVLDESKIIVRSLSIISCCPSIGSGFEPFQRDRYHVKFQYTIPNGSYHNHTPGTAICDWNYGRCGVGGTYTQFIWEDATEEWDLETSGCSGLFCGHTCGTGKFYLTKEIVSENNLTIYFNIVDLKKQYEANGLPWTNDCSVDRFEFYYSTTKCESYYCKSFIVAENIDINNLGDISYLTGKVWSSLTTN